MSNAEVSISANQKFKFEGLAEIPLERISPNPSNPRPTYQMGDDDPHLISLGDSIRNVGQHRPAVVYELVGHYRHPDNPENYMLLQGESRWRACGIARVPTLRCLVAVTPRSEAEEWEWLGNEESFKREWGTFFLYRFAKDLAQSHGYNVCAHPEIATMTGLSMDQLKIADKIFSLEEPIRALVAEYEELMYAQRRNGNKARSGRLAARSQVKTNEFPVAKAALVWDIYEALMKYCPATVTAYDPPLELQRRISMWASKASKDKLEEFLANLNFFGKKPVPGFLTQIADMLESPERGLSSGTLAGQGQLRKLNTMVRQLATIEKSAKYLLRQKDNLGSDVDALGRIRTALVLHQRLVRDLEDTIFSAIKVIEQGGS